VGQFVAVLTGDPVFLFPSFYAGGVVLLLVVARCISSSLASGRIGVAGSVASPLCALASFEAADFPFWFASSISCSAFLFQHCCYVLW
jgi:hypothetical protein